MRMADELKDRKVAIVLCGQTITPSRYVAALSSAMAGA
jgi:hypothetical protein